MFCRKGDERQQRVRLSSQRSLDPLQRLHQLLMPIRGIGVCVVVGGLTRREFLVPLQACRNLLGFILRCQAADKRPNNKNWYLYLKWLLLFFFFCGVGGLFIYFPTLSLLFASPICWQGAHALLCASLRVRARMLFLGKPNKDEQGGWIQAASVSGA